MTLSVQPSLLSSVVCVTLAMMGFAGMPSAHADDLAFAWAQSMGGTGADRVEGVAVDAAGNVYSTGLFSASGGTFGIISGSPVVLSSAGGTDVFITKHDRNGNLLWAKKVGGKSVDSGLGIAVDAQGSVFVTGYFAGSADLDPGPDEFELDVLGSDFECFLLKLNTNGEFVWAKAIGLFGADRGTRVAVDPEGNVVLAGVFSGEANFNPGGVVPFPLTSKGNEDVFVAKYTTNGAFLWAGSWGSTAVDWVNGLDIDADGNIYTAGRFVFTVDFDPGPGVFELTSQGSNNAFVSKLDKNGALVWARAFPAAEANDVAVAPDGSVYVTGYFNTTRDFDPDPDDTFNMTSAGAKDGYLSKFSANGNFQWAIRFGSFRDDEGHRVAVDSSGAVYLTGEFDTGLGSSFPADFGPIDFLTNGGIDTFLAKLTAQGEYELLTKLGGVSNDVPMDLVVDAKKSIFIGGYFLVSGNFNPLGEFTLTSAGGTDGYLVKLTQGEEPGPSTDINGDGVVNAVDVQIVINSALGIATQRDADVNGDGVVNAVDVQLVINAALGIQSS